MENFSVTKYRKCSRILGAARKSSWFTPALEDFSLLHPKFENLLRYTDGKLLSHKAPVENLSDTVYTGGKLLRYWVHLSKSSRLLGNMRPIEKFSGTGYTDGKVFSVTGYADGKVFGYWVH